MHLGVSPIMFIVHVDVPALNVQRSGFQGNYKE